MASASGCWASRAEEHPVALQLGGSDPAQARRGGRDRRGLRLRRDQPQRRLPVGPRAGGPLRRLPDGRARAGGRLRRGDAARACACPSPSSAASASTTRTARRTCERFVDDGRGGRLPHLHRARAQGLAEGPVAQGEPRDAAARLRPRVPAEGGASASSRSSSTAASRSLEEAQSASARRRRRDARPRGLSDPLPAGRGRSRAVRRGQPRRRRGARCWRQLLPYAERHLRGGGRLNNITRHILGLYHGRPRARAFRRHLSEQAPRDGAGIEVLREAIAIAEGEARPWRRRNSCAASGRLPPCDWNRCARAWSILRLGFDRQVASVR